MMKVFVDTNVILDLVLGREGEEQALDLFQLGEDKKIELTVSFLSMANVAYIARKNRTKEELYEYLKVLSSLFCILEMDENQFLESLETIVSDFEDYLQYTCAKRHYCDVLITNNVKHFGFSEIPVYTPHSFLEKYT